MLRYAITDRQMFPGGKQARREALLANIHRLAQGGADVIQMREKGLSPSDLEALARRAMLAFSTPRKTLVQPPSETPPQAAPKFLLNGPARIAASVRADGVHLPGESSPADLTLARKEFQSAGLAPPLLSTSCHTIDEVQQAALVGFDYILFGPVFEKRVHGELVSNGLGVNQLREAAASMRRSQPSTTSRLLALGGITEKNVELCLRAGADGVAGIRLFL